MCQRNGVPGHGSIIDLSGQKKDGGKGKKREGAE